MGKGLRAHGFRGWGLRAWGCRKKGKSPGQLAVRKPLPWDENDHKFMHSYDYRGLNEESSGKEDGKLYGNLGILFLHPKLQV